MDNSELLNAQKICNEGVVYMDRKAYSKALSYFDKAQSVFVENKSLDWVAYLYHQRFICYFRLGRSAESLKIATNVIDSYKIRKNKKGMISFLVTYSELWQQSNDLSKALHYAKIAESMTMIYKTNSYLSTIYLRLAEIYTEYKFYLKAIYYYKKALALFTQEAQQHSQAQCWGAKGVLYHKILLVDEALAALQKSVKIFLVVKDIKMVIKNLEKIRKIYLELGETEKARRIETEIVKLGQKEL